LYNKSDRVGNFFNKCIDYVVDTFHKDPEVMKLIKSKSYVQLKLEFSYNKPYEPVIGYVRRSFYTQCLPNRSNLVQSVDILRTALENQVKDILIMIDKFEHASSYWILNKWLKFTVRFIK
jgi:hypothetical protein